MRHTRRAIVLSAAVLALGPLPAYAFGSSADAPAQVQTWLQEELADAAPSDALRVYVHADTAASARDAVAASGLRLVEVFDKVGVAVADGTPAQIDAVRSQAGVSYVEGDQPIEFDLDTSHIATRGAEAIRTLNGADGSDLDGSGISIAVIDSGIDGTHPFFREADGSSKVVRNLKSVCPFVDNVTGYTSECLVDVPGNDSDSPSTGGHGTHVAGIAAGNPTVLSDGRTVMGAAPGAKLVGLSVGQAISVYGGNTGLNWVLENHAAPCGAGVSAAQCPPIRVTNNSYGVSGGSDFNANSVTAKLQRALLLEGVLTVWSAGNSAGDGTTRTTNGNGADPTPGILSVASYNDGGTGTRDGALSTFSSRGKRGVHGTYPDISAPGDTILSSCRPYLAVCNSSATVPVDGPGATDVATFNTISGTSMAAPHIAGIIAQLLEGKPDATPEQVELALEDGAHRFAAGGAYEADPLNPGSQTSFDKGHGLVDVMGAYAELTGTTAPPVASAPCTASYTDRRGDATNLLGNSGLTPNDPALDVVGGTLSTTAEGVLLTVEVDDLVAGPNGQIVEQTFAVRGATYYVFAQRATGDGTLSFEYGDMGSATGGRRLLGTTTGAFDDAADTVSILFPRTVLTPALADGEVLGGLTVTTRRDGVLLIPDADTATASCPYTVGAATVEETASPTPSAEPTDTATASPTATATASPTATATTEPTATASPSPTRKGGKPTSTASPSCQPKGKGGNCG